MRSNFTSGNQKRLYEARCRQARRHSRRYSASLTAERVGATPRSIRSRSQPCHHLRHALGKDCRVTANCCGDSPPKSAPHKTFAVSTHVAFPRWLAKGSLGIQRCVPCHREREVCRLVRATLPMAHRRHRPSGSERGVHRVRGGGPGSAARWPTDCAKPCGLGAARRRSDHPRVIGAADQMADCGRESIVPRFGHNGLAPKAKVLCRSAGYTSNVWGTAAEPGLVG